MTSDTLRRLPDVDQRGAGASLAASASRPTERAKSAAFMSFWLRTEVLAPLASSKTAESSLPYRAAIIRAVLPLGEGASTCAPRSSKSATSRGSGPVAA